MALGNNMPSPSQVIKSFSQSELSFFKAILIAESFWYRSFFRSFVLLQELRLYPGITFTFWFWKFIFLRVEKSLQMFPRLSRECGDRHQISRKCKNEQTRCRKWTLLRRSSILVAKWKVVWSDLKKTEMDLATLAVDCFITKKWEGG